MSTEVSMQESAVVPQTSSSGKWSQEDFQLLKDTVCKGATDSEFKLFCYSVVRTGLDPFMRQIHAVKRWNKKKQCEEMAIQVGIDGYRLIAERTGKYAGSDEYLLDDDVKPRKATVTVYKMVEGIRCAFTASARWNEYYPGTKSGFMWDKMPCVMLGKVAEALALRKAFPAELSGVYTNEEMDQAGPSRELDEWKMTPEQRTTLKEAINANGYSLEDLNAIVAQYGGKPRSLQEYRDVLFAMSQTKPKVKLVHDADWDASAEMARMAKSEALKHFDAQVAEIERRLLEDMEAVKGCISRN